MEKLPKEAINKIFFFISHPVADIFRVELEIAYLRLRVNEELDISCDCCGKLWSLCRCLCSICHDDYRSCRYGCYDTYLMLSS